MLGDSFVGEPAKLGVLFNADEMAVRVEASNRGSAAADAVVEYNCAFAAECPNQVLEEFDGFLVGMTLPVRVVVDHGNVDH